MTASSASSGLGLFLGKKRSRPFPTLVIAALVTCAVAIPLILIAVDERNNPTQEAVVLAPADSSRIVVGSDGGSLPLDLETISGPVMISITDDDASSVSFSLFAAGADSAVIASRDIAGPQFDLVVGEDGTSEPFDSNLLVDGDYELFVTIRTADEDRRTAVAFSVNNS